MESAKDEAAAVVRERLAAGAPAAGSEDGGSMAASATSAEAEAAPVGTGSSSVGCR